jgi:hypothetical protein
MSEDPIMTTAALLVGALTLSEIRGAGRTPRNSPRHDTMGPSGEEPIGELPATIPDRAMLQPADLHGASTFAVEDDGWVQVRPPQPGGADAYASAAARHGQRAVSAVVIVGATSTFMVEYVATYRPGGARRYWRDLRRALGGRHGDEQDGRWTVLASGMAGRDSMLLRLRETVERAGRTVCRDTYVALARVGRLLVVVASPGRDAADGHREVAENLIRPAVRRASILL